MASLLDIVKQNLQSAGTDPKAAPGMSQTEKAARLAAGRSGKAGGAPQAIDDTSEKMANADTGQKLEDVQTAGVTAAAGIAATSDQQQAEHKSATIDVEQRRQAVIQSTNIKKQQLVDELGRGKAEGRLNRDKSKQEELAQLLRLNDKKYIDALELQGARQRLDSSSGFREAMEQAQFGDNLAILQGKLKKNSILAASDREYKEALSKISLDDAIALATQQAAATKKMGTDASTNDLAKAGISGYTSYEKGEFKDNPTQGQDNTYNTPAPVAGRSTAS